MAPPKTVPTVMLKDAPLYRTAVGNNSANTAGRRSFLHDKNPMPCRRQS